VKNFADSWKNARNVSLKHELEELKAKSIVAFLSPVITTYLKKGRDQSMDVPSVAHRIPGTSQIVAYRALL